MVYVVNKANKYPEKMKQGLDQFHCSFQLPSWPPTEDHEVVNLNN